MSTYSNIVNAISFFPRSIPVFVGRTKAFSGSDLPSTACTRIFCLPDLPLKDFAGDGLTSVSVRVRQGKRSGWRRGQRRGVCSSGPVYRKGEVLRLHPPATYRKSYLLRGFLTSTLAPGYGWRTRFREIPPESLSRESFAAAAEEPNPPRFPGCLRIQREIQSRIFAFALYLTIIQFHFLFCSFA